MTTVSAQLDPSGRLDIVIDAPPVNAFSIELLSELIELLRNVPDEVRVVVLRSVGRGFSAGGDIKEMRSLPGHVGITRQIRDGLAACVAIENCPVPVIAAVHGYVIGIGALLAGVCDIIVAARDTEFIFAEVDNGAASGAVQGLGLLPEKRLRTAMFTGAPVAVDELLTFGSVHSIVAAAELSDATNELAAAICAKPNSVIRALKKAINGSVGRDLTAKYLAEASHTFELHMMSGAADASD